MHKAESGAHTGISLLPRVALSVAQNIRFDTVSLSYHAKIQRTTLDVEVFGSAFLRVLYEVG